MGHGPRTVPANSGGGHSAGMRDYDGLGFRGLGCRVYYRAPMIGFLYRVITRVL